jgi:hypothetical protein
LVKDGKNLEEIRPIEIRLVDQNPDWQGRTYLATAIEVIYHSLTVQKG